jgi:hypothetical protein
MALTERHQLTDAINARSMDDPPYEPRDHIADEDDVILMKLIVTFLEENG